MIRITTIVPPAKAPAPARKAAAAKIAAAPKVSSKRPAKVAAPAKKTTKPKAATAPKKHEADTANEAMIADAVSFKVSLFLGRGAYDRSEVSTLQLAANRAAEMKAAHPECTREVMVHGVTAANRTMLVPPALLLAAEPLPGATVAQFRASAELLADDAPTTASPLIDQIRAAQPADDIADIMAEVPAGAELVGVVNVKARAAAKAMPEPAAADVPTQAPPSPAKPVSGKRAEAQAAAERGELPQPPDFSAETHKNYRKKLAALVALAKDGDIAGLRAFELKLYSSSPIALDRYRNLCVTALSAQAKGA